MQRRLLSTTMTVILVLAFFLAWTGHAYSLSVSSQPSAKNIETSHGHAHDASSPSCSKCSDHYHSPLTPDHQHETPQLTSVVQLATRFEPSVRQSQLGDPVPFPPIFRIERPPRAALAS